MLFLANLTNTMQKPKKNMTETLAHEYSSESTQPGLFRWIPTWQGLDGFQKSLHPCRLEEK